MPVFFRHVLKHELLFVDGYAYAAKFATLHGIAPCVVLWGNRDAFGADLRRRNEILLSFFVTIPEGLPPAIYLIFFNMYSSGDRSRKAGASCASPCPGCGNDSRVGGTFSERVLRDRDWVTIRGPTGWRWTALRCRVRTREVTAGTRWSAVACEI